MKRLCYVNGKIESADTAAIGISDLALQRGYGIFDYGRTYNGKLFHFEENIVRFRRSASELRLSLTLSNEEIREITEELIKGSDLESPAVRMMLTGGYSPTLEEPNFIIIAEELPTYPIEIYEKGVNLMTVEFQRELPHVKTVNYLNSIRLEPLMLEKKAYDLLYHSQHGITECPRNNFFGFIQDTLVTPSDFILRGVTRKLVLQLASGKFAIEEREVRIEELDDFDEAFVTSTTKGVLPVTRIDSRGIGKGEVGNRTNSIMNLFCEYTEGY